jgi:hypothetical protein
MKKAVAIFLLAVYGFAASGATIHAHYCMNRLISWNMWLGNPKFCKNCGMAKEKSHGCCRDEQHTVKMHADHPLALSNHNINGFSQHIPVTPFLFYSALNIQSSFIVYPVSHAPPNASTNKLYLRHRVFLI